MTNPSQELKKLVEKFRERQNSRYFANWCADELEALLPTVAAECERLREALAGIMKLIDNGELVRDISHDHESSYALRAINFVVKLKAAQEALEAKQPGARKGEGA